MKFLIAVLFICSSDKCQFVHGEKKYFDKPSCAQDVASAVIDARSKGFVVEGSCIAINTKDLL
jgi:hypothetical protein